MDKILLSFQLPQEPLTKDRSFVLFETATGWNTSYLDNETGEYYGNNSHSDLALALLDFNHQLQNQLNRYNHFTSMFFKYRDLIATQEVRN
jgi:hypothetical protein